ncbi:peptidoglycan recognition family protein [Planctomycetota bacterium]
MLNKVFILLMMSFLVLNGCTYNDEPVPEITSISRPLPGTATVSKPPKLTVNITPNVPRGWIPPSRLEKRWTAIVIHHSATNDGNAKIFDKYHKENRHWAGVGYDFVIGNGRDSGDGQVEVTFRWREQKVGAHCKSSNNWANIKAVGICLIGDFNRTSPTKKQMRSLVRLVRFLQQQYKIPKSRIYGHNTTPRARPTECPGKYFSMARFKAMLDSN